MAKSSGGGNKSAHTRHNNNNTDPEVDGRENKLGGSSRLAKHDPLQTYSQNLTNKELREVRDIDALDKQNPLAVTEFVNDMFNLVSRGTVDASELQLHEVANGYQP